MTDPEPAPDPLELESLANFLPDAPLEKETYDAARFGHNGVAETLRAIVKRCEAPFTIALYGSWGTGKSSVVGLLKGCLEKDDIPTIVVDVWKYQDDPLRRTVLHEMDRQGRAEFPEVYDFDFKLDDRVEQATSLATEFKLGIDFRRMWKTLKERRLAGSSVILVLGALVVLGVSFKVYPAQTGAIVASITAGVAAVLATLGAAALLLTPKTSTLSKGRYADPYEFENEFLQVLNKGYKAAPKVLIVFDNLDRVDEDRAVEVLSTVKTFLESKPERDLLKSDGEQEQPKAVFLVPCDDKAIRQQVAKRFTDGEGDEFLRKFFNVSLRLPSFLHTELEDYTLDLLRTTGIPALDNPVIAWMTAKAFRSNPRQVKQFVNVLVAESLLANRRSSTEELPKDFLQENVVELALFNILATRFPGVMEARLANNEFSLAPEHLTQSNDFEKFVQQVAHEATIDDIRSWFALRRSEHEARLPGVEQFLLDLQDGKTDEAAEFISSLGFDQEKQRDLSAAVQLRMARISQPTTFVVSLSTLLFALSQNGQTLTDTTTRELLVETHRHLQASPELIATRLNPRWLVSALDSQPRQQGPFIQAWVDALKGYAENAEAKRDRRFLESLMTVLASHADWFKSQEAETRTALAGVVGKDEELVRILATGGGDTWMSPELALNLIESLGEV